MVHIPYKGDAAVMSDLLGGRLQLTIASALLLPQVKEGRLRVLATLLPNRSPLAPDAPTFSEAGIPGLSISPWLGLFGPARMRRDVVGRVSRELVNSLALHTVREQLGQLAFEGQSSSPEELAILVRDQLAIWRKAGREAGLQAE